MSRRGAIFDWDGVIINSAEHHERSWERLATESGQPLFEGHFKAGFGMKNEVIIPELLKWTTDLEEIQRLSLRKEAIYREVVIERGVVALPGVETWLKMLRAAGVACVIASSTHRQNILVSLDTIGLGSYFEAIVSAEDVQRGKPDPEVFLAAAKKLGVAAADAVVFEDALVGVAAAQAAKMRVATVTTTNPRAALVEARADWVVDRLDQLSVEELWRR
jgi:beta-phosphoglucomutase family hydrolase